MGSEREKLEQHQSLGEHPPAEKQCLPFKASPFSPLCTKGKTQEVTTESISEVYTEECQEKHSERAHPPRPS